MNTEKKTSEDASCPLDGVVMHKTIFKWEPFTYICEGFNGEKENIGGFLPSDVRWKAAFTVKKIHGPIVTGILSWAMFQAVNGA